MVDLVCRELWRGYRATPPSRCALTWVRNAPTDNGYAHPVDGLQVLVDLNKMQVLRIDDTGSILVPVQADGNYTPDYIKEFRTDLKPLEINQADGPSFTVHGNASSWQKWRFRVGFTPREGLVLYTISYTDQGRVRPSFIGLRWWIWWCPMAIRIKS